jgi:hypothetical protein
MNPREQSNTMKRALSVVSFIALVLSGAWADVPPPGGEPEYYYTRVMYTGVDTPERGGPVRFKYPPELDFKCSDLAPGEGGRGGGWRTDYPASDCKFIWGVERLTGIKAYREAPHPMNLMDPKIFDFPYLYIVEPGQMILSDEEAEILRQHLLRGGFLHVDDFWGKYQFGNFEEQMAKVFPERTLEPVPLSHEIFHTFFDIDTVMQIPNVNNGCRGGRTWESATDIEPRIYGIKDDKDRLMVIATYNSDLGDAWEHMDVGCYPEKYSGQAYRMGVNFIIYAMTH